MDNKDNANDHELFEAIAPCEECGAGVLRMNSITYFTWLNEELITVPNFPAWICDVCGRREFDPRAVAWLNTLLNPSAGRKPKMRPGRRNRTSGTNRLRP